MGNEQQNMVMRRKAKAGREDAQARRMSVGKALRLSFAKVANELLGLPLAVIGATAAAQPAEGLDEILEAEALLMLLEGPRGQKGAAMLDGALVGGLVQQQTLGKVQPDGSEAGRPMTATDAALCAPVLEGLMKRAAPLPDDPAERALLTGFEFGAHVAAPRLLRLALEGAEYRVLRLTLDLAGGVRQGALTMILPEPEAADLTPETDGSDAAAAEPSPGGATLCDNVLGLKAELNIGLATLSLPLRQVGKLAVGDVLPLGVTAFDRIRVLTLQGRDLAGGSLGQVSGMRAVRLAPRPKVQDHPQRRAEDRAALDQPEVTGDGTGLGPVPVQPATASALPDLSDLGGVPEPEADQPPAMPDMSDLPGLAEMEGLGLPLDGLPDLDLPTNAAPEDQREVG